MATINSLEWNAHSFISKLDRSNIFPPNLNDPSSYLSKSISKKTLNSFFICRTNVIYEAKKKNISINMKIVCKATSILWNTANLNEQQIYTEIATQVATLNNKRKLALDSYTTENIFEKYHSNTSYCRNVTQYENPIILNCNNIEYITILANYSYYSINQI